MSSQETVQSVAAIAGSISAVGTLAAAVAAAVSARTAAASSRRSAETLARERQPRVQASITVPMGWKADDPAELYVDVSLEGDHPARQVMVDLERADQSGEPNLSVGPIERLGPRKPQQLKIAVGQPLGPSSFKHVGYIDVLRLTVRYQDDSRTLTWHRESGEWGAQRREIRPGETIVEPSFRVDPFAEAVELGVEAKAGYLRNLWRAIWGRR